MLMFLLVRFSECRSLITLLSLSVSQACPAMIVPNSQKGSLRFKPDLFSCWFTPVKVILHGTIRNEDFERNTALQFWNDVVRLCCAENRRCDSSRVTSPKVPLYPPPPPQSWVHLPVNEKKWPALWLVSKHFVYSCYKPPVISPP